MLMGLYWSWTSSQGSQNDDDDPDDDDDGDGDGDGDDGWLMCNDDIESFKNGIDELVLAESESDIPVIVIVSLTVRESTQIGGKASTGYRR
jgi:hypothetical protein